MSIEESTAARLGAYYGGFDQDVIDTVAELADRQAAYGHDYGRFLTDTGFAGTQTVPGPNGLPNQVVDIRREHERDDVLVYHLPMANPLDDNQLYQIATIAAANPNHRLIAMGNPSGGGYDSGRLTVAQCLTVFAGDLWPTVEPMAMYLDKNHKGGTTTQIGYSFGADKAAELATSEHIGVVNRLVAIEPVVGVRGLARLGYDFGRSAKALGEYTAAPELEAYDSARDHAISAFGYNMGLLRASNLAIANALKRGTFAPRLIAAHTTHRHMVSTVAWGGDSELAGFESIDDLLHDEQVQRSRLQDGWFYTPSSDKLDVRGIYLPGQKHALANDVHLQTAIVTQSIAR